MDTFLSLLLEKCRKIPDIPAFRTKYFGIWNVTTWSQAQERVSVLAQGLERQGVEAGSRFGVFGPNQTDLYLTYLAAQSLGAIPVPIDSNAFGEELLRFIDIAEIDNILAFEQQHVDALLECGQSRVQKIIYIKERGLDTYTQSGLVSLESVLEGISPSLDFLMKLDAQRHPDETAVIAFCSGAGRAERPVELSHGALIATARSIARREVVTGERRIDGLSATVGG